MRVFFILILLISNVSILGCTSKDREKSPDIFYNNNRTEPKTLNAFASRTEGAASRINQHIFDTLLDHHHDTYEIIPALAESYKISNEGKSFTFTLREGVKFSDGKPVTTEDVKFSFEAIFDDNYDAISVRPYYEKIKSANIIDERTIRFDVSEKYFLNLEILGSMWIVPKHVYGDPENKMNTNAIGSGPFVLDSFKNGRSIVLKRNEEWWGRNVEYFKDFYKFKKKVYRFIKEENVTLEALKKGDLDYESLSAEQYVLKTDGPPWGQTVEKVVVKNRTPVKTPFIGWNLKNDLFKNRDVRRALTHLYDREMLAKKFFFDKAVPATGPWYQQNPAADPNRKPLPYDPALAKKLIAAQGWADKDKNGVLEKMIDGKKKEFRFTLLNPNPDYEKYFTVYKEELKKVGIEMNITNLEWNAFIRKIDEHEFEACFLVWGGQVEIEPKQVWHSASSKKGGSNFISYKNPEVDRLIDQGRLELDREKRHKIFRKVYNIIADDAPYVFLVNYTQSFYAYNTRMERPQDYFQYSVGADLWSVRSAK